MGTAWRPLLLVVAASADLLRHGILQIYRNSFVSDDWLCADGRNTPIRLATGVEPVTGSCTVANGSSSAFDDFFEVLPWLASSNSLSALTPASKLRAGAAPELGVA